MTAVGSAGSGVVASTTTGSSAAASSSAANAVIGSIEQASVIATTDARSLLRMFFILLLLIQFVFELQVILSAELTTKRSIRDNNLIFIFIVLLFFYRCQYLEHQKDSDYFVHYSYFSSVFPYFCSVFNTIGQILLFIYSTPVSQYHSINSIHFFYFSARFFIFRR